MRAAHKAAQPNPLPAPACHLIKQISPGLITQQEFITALEKAPEIRLLAEQMAGSKKRPPLMWRAQRQAWQAVIRARKKLMKAGQEFDQMMAAAKKVMEEKPSWERDDRVLREEFIQACEQVRNKTAAREISAVREIRKKMADKLQEAAVRAPILRRVMSRPRSNAPIPIGVLEKGSMSLPRPQGIQRVQYETSSTKTPNSAPPTDQLASS